MIQLVLTLALATGAPPAQAVAASPALDTLVLTHASVLPMTGGGMMRDWTIIVAGDEIVALHPTATQSIPAGATVHDLGGDYVIPGLIDAHVHLREPDRSLVLFPAAGVTTVVNLEGRPRHLALRDSIQENGAVAPRILSSGPFLEEIVGTPEQARQEVRRQHEAGYDLVKIHGDIEADVYAAALDEAGRAGLPVVAHRPGNLPTSAVLASDLAALAHAEELLGSSLLSEPVPLSDDSAEAIGRVIAESGTAVITTLAFFTGMRDQATDRFYQLIQQPELAYVSPERRRGWLYDGHREYIDHSELPWYDTAVAALHRITGAVHDQGGTIIAGTDTPLEFTIPGFSMHRELERLVAAGLTPREALQAATTAPSELLGHRELGRIEVGAAADLLVLSSDPTASLEALERPEAVVLRGRWLSAESLDRELETLAAAYARDEVSRAARERVQEGIVALVREHGTDAAAAEVRRLAEIPGAPRLTEADLNSIGYRLLTRGEVESAIQLFRLNVRLHPESANAHDSLGEALLEAGRLDQAERSYRQALELDATLDSARRGLRKIAERRGETSGARNTGRTQDTMLPTPGGLYPVGVTEYTEMVPAPPDSLARGKEVSRAVRVVLWYPAVPGTGGAPVYLTAPGARAEAMGTDFVAAAERTRSHARRNADPATRAAPLPAGRGLHVLRTWLVWFLDRHVRSRPSARPPDPVLFPEVRFTAYGEDWSQDRPGS